MATTAIIGIGNVLMGDDAVGPYALKLIEARYTVPETVILLDAGTPGPDLANLLSGYAAAIVIDAVQAGGAAGAIHRYDLTEGTSTCVGPLHTAHDPGLAHAMDVLELAGARPTHLVLIGVTPQRVDRGPGLSPPVLSALEKVIAAVKDELQRLGISLVQKIAPNVPDLWWEAPS
jgi:hydrogenase maturation protease